MSAATARTAVSAEQTGRRVEELLDGLSTDPAAQAAAEELVRVLMDFYGAGLARVVTLLGAQHGEALARLADDELVSALLALHDLHPQEVTARIERALAAVPAHPARVEHFDPATGALRLRLEGGGGSGCGCASTAQTARQSLEAALGHLAPEVTSLELDTPEPARPAPALLQIGHRPGLRTEAPAEAR
ncbi:hypothetical protein [Kitasatospora sp. McL0602]|uniref:hypothetical protein n=1 Tax=Kitasatospora sp. McL0602 TaxID=3439530 RepID=UPI003F89F4A9